MNTKDPVRLTQFLKIMLLISSVAAIVVFVSDVFQMYALSSADLMKHAEVNFARQQIIEAIGAGLFIITGIGFLIWVYRANANVRALGAQGLKYTPGWSVGYYFVPIACVSRPYEAMKEIWQASKNPDTWEKESVSPIVWLWWTSFIISGFTSWMEFIHSMRELHSVSIFVIVADMIDIATCFLALTLVSNISRMQQKLIRSVGIAMGNVDFQNAAYPTTQRGIAG